MVTNHIMRREFESFVIGCHILSIYDEHQLKIDF